MNAGHLRRTAHPDPSSGFWSPNRRQNVAPGADFDLARDNSVYYVLNLVGFTAFAFAGREITRTMSDDRKLTFEWVQSLSSLFKYLRDKHAIKYNPAKDVQRPKAESGEGKTPAIADLQARKLLDAPDETRPSLLRQGRLSDKDNRARNKRDRAILSTLLFHGLRREELCNLKVRDFRHVRRRAAFKVSVKGGKTRMCRCIRAPTPSSSDISTPPVTALTKMALCSVPSETTGPLGSYGSKMRSRRRNL